MIKLQIFCWVIFFYSILQGIYTKIKILKLERLNHEIAKLNFRCNSNESQINFLIINSFKTDEEFVKEYLKRKNKLEYEEQSTQKLKEESWRE